MCIENKNENENEILNWYENVWKYMEKDGNEKTELKLQKKYTLGMNWNAYDPFFKQPVFLVAAFAFGSGFFLAAAFAFDCNLLRATDW